MQGRYFLFGLILASLTLPAFADDDNPCGGPAMMLSLVNRPTASDSACVVPYKHIELEAGYTYQQLIYSTGYAQNAPQSQLRFGLPLDTEIITLLPNYFHQTISPHAGWGTAGLAVKHNFYAKQPLVLSAEVGTILPGGSVNFGTTDWGFFTNGLLLYNFSSTLSIELSFGWSTLTFAKHSGGERVNSINPDVVLSYNITPRTVLYGEVFAQTKTAPHLGGGSFCDGGIIYLLKPTITIDAELGQKLSGNVAGFNHYVGTGIAILF